MKARDLCVVLLAVLGLPSLLIAQGPPEASRVEAIARMLPAAPRGVGRPITDRAAWGVLAKSPAAAKVIKRAEGLLGQPLPELTDDLFLEFSRNGNRTRCQQVLGIRHGRLGPLAAAECIEYQGRFLPEIEKTLVAICDEKTWVLPAHDGGLTNFKGTRITIDLRSSAVGWELATVDYWLGARLSPAVRQRVRDELARRIFKPYERMVNEGKPRPWWLVGRSNWNAVCLANVTGAAMAGVESPARRAFYVASAEKYIQYYLEGFTDDGYCSEGLGYWNYGFGHFVKLAETIFQATGGGVDLMADPRVRRIARFGRRMEIAPGVYPAFADCPPHATPASWIEGYVSRRFDFGWPEGSRDRLPLGDAGSPVMTGLFCFPNSASAREVGPAEPRQLPPRDWFDKAGVLICRPASESTRSLGVALKGGHNAEQHNHNDVGSFVVALAGHATLVDPGSEVYTRRTFGSRRYESGVLSSWGHPVPRVAGQLQRPGRRAAAKALSTEWTDDADTLVLDLRTAYDVESLKKLTRSFVYSRRGAGGLEVTDRVAFERPEAFGTALITFDSWKRTGPNMLRIGTGEAAVDARIDTGGEPFDIDAKPIEEDLPEKRLPTRLGIDLARPVDRATIRLTIRPAE
ncbi:MAG TPA: heparinase II/III family protein [Thermoguttaceae bacterium]|nr:heparinase II/III family protein [Thermoguttaceae bacterium]